VEIIDFYNNEDLRILTSLIQAVHKFSNLEEIYRVALDSVTELENVDMAMIYLVDERKREAVLKAYRNLPEDYIERARRIPYPKGVTWKVINTGKILNIEDVQKDPDVGPAGRDMGPHGVLGIPIFLEEKVIGVIWFVSYKEYKFNEREISLLSTLGNQIAIAISRTKQTEELEQRNENLSILSAISQAVHESVDLNKIYETVLDITKDLRFIDLVALYLVEGEGDRREAVLQIQRGYPKEYLKRASRIPYPKGVTWKVITSGEVVYYEDTSDPSAIIGPAGKVLGQRALLCIPLKSGNQTIGMIGFSSFEKISFTQQEFDFLLSLGSQIGTAIAKARMFEEIRRREEALRQSEERYRDLVENSLDLICTHDLEGNILSVNRALIKKLGYESAKDIVGRKISDFLSPDVRHLFDSYINTIVKNGEARGLMKVLTRSGEERVLEYSNSLRTEGVDEPIVRGRAHDVTERNRAEEALRNSLAQLSKKSRYEAIISTVTQSVHKSLNLQEVLENAVESISKNIDGVDIIGILLVEGQEAVLKAHRGYPDWFLKRMGRIPYPKGFTWKTIIEGKPGYAADTDQDTVIGPAGREAGTKSYISMPIHFGGETVGVININSFQRNVFSEEDLTLLEIVVQQIEVAINNARQAEALRESREKFRNLVEQTNDFVWEIDENGAFTYVNPKAYEILGYEPEEILGRTVFDFMSSDEAKRFAEVIGSFISIKSPFKNLEKTLIHKDGHAVVLEASGSPIFNAEGILRGYRGIARDITERKKAEEALRKAHEELEARVRERTAALTAVNEALEAEISERKRVEEQIKASLQEKEVLLREIHHRVKNNLQVISSLLNLQAGYIKDKQILKAFTESQMRIRSMSLIHEQLYKSKDLARIDFSRYIRELTDNLKRSYGMASSLVEFNIDVGRVSLGIDMAIPCGLIINELVSNSLKHAFPGGREGEISISLQGRATSLPNFVLTVSDNGIGFPKDLDFRNTESLGLQLVTVLVNQIGGTIELNRDSGTEFKITFKELKKKKG